MTLKTVPILIELLTPAGEPAANAIVTSQLVDAKGRNAVATYDGAVVVPAQLTAVAGDDGKVLMGHWPNERGTVPTLYRVIAKWGEIELLNTTIAVTDSDPEIEIPIGDIISASPYPAPDAAQLAVQQAQAHAQAARADRLLADGDVLQTAANVASSGVNADAAAASASLSTSSMLTAIAQAAMASVFALNAASAAQQDLSGVEYAPLHRCPNPIVQDIVYNTAQDSDGGAWRDKVDASYISGETLNGAWINASNGVPTEIMARALGGTLGTNLVTSNAPTDWTAGPSNTLSAILGGGVRATSAGSAAVRMQRQISGLTPGKPYVLYTHQIPGGGASATNTRASSNGGTSYDLIAAAQGTYGGVFVATASGTCFVDVYSSTTAAGNYIDVPTIFLREVQAFATSGSYYPNATDGKFYRLWKNLVANNSNFAAASWLKNAVAVTPDAATTSDGVSADLIYPTSTGASRTVNQNVTGINGQAHTHTWRVKAAGKTWAMFWNVQGNVSLWVNLATGALGTQGAGFSNVSASLGADGFVTVKYTSTLSGVSATSYMAPCDADNTSTATANGTDGVLLADMQIEVGAVATAIEAKGADGSQSETFRGNTSRFPRLTPEVAEGGRVILWAVDQPGRPMWMVLPAAGLSGSSMLTGISTITSCAMVGGKLVIGTSTAGVFIVDFAKDTCDNYLSTQLRRFNGTIAQRAQALGYTTIATGAGNVIASNTVNAVAVCVMPDAPVDPITGLQVPTIAVGGPGSAIIQNNGTVATNVTAGTVHNITITPDVLTMSNSGSGTLSYATKPGQLTGSFSVLTISGTGNQWSAYANAGVLMPSRHTVIRRSGTRLSRMRFNESTPAASLYNEITDASNTGWMTGDIRRCLLSDVAAGAVSGAELLTNGTFDTDVTGWTAGVAPNSSIGWQAGGVMRITSSATVGFGYAYQAIPTVPGVTYSFVVALSGASASAGFFRAGTTINGFDLGNSTGLIAGGAALTITFTATGTTTYLTLGVNNSNASSTADFDSASAKAVVADRSYKAKHLTVNGALTKALVGGVAMYSGWSAANYGFEAYSADLDPATGAVFVPFFGTIPTNVSAVGWAFERGAAAGAFFKGGHDATGKLTCTFSDGTTPRTITTAAAYNTGLPIGGGFLYEPSGTVSIIVNGRRVASATGAPLGPLSNAAATLTVGIDRALSAPWAGSLALVHFGMTAPSDDALSFKYEQERAMFRDGAQVALADSGALVDLAYDPSIDRLTAISAANESSFTGLIRTRSQAVAAGSYTKIGKGSGVRLTARSTTNPGVDISMPSLNLREELLRRAEDAARANRQTVNLDWVGGATATVTSGSSLVDNIPVASRTPPNGATYQGAQVTVSSHFTGTRTILFNDPVAARAWLDVASTGTGVATISFLDFILPLGMEAACVLVAGTDKREGAANDFVRRFDGFRETIRFNAAPGATAWVQIQARRAA